MKVFKEDENELWFNEACKVCKHEEIIKVGNRLIQIHFGPEHDSYSEIEK